MVMYVIIYIAKKRNISERKEDMKLKKNILILVILPFSMVTSSGVLADEMVKKANGNIQVNIGSTLRQDVRGWGVTNTCQYYERKDQRAGDSQTFHELGVTILRYELPANTGNADGSSTNGI